MNIPIFIQLLQQFKNYCYEFYNNETGIYPIATKEEIDSAIFKYITRERVTELQFDSIDREGVRLILNK